MVDLNHLMTFIWDNWFEWNINRECLSGIFGDFMDWMPHNLGKSNVWLSILQRKPGLSQNMFLLFLPFTYFHIPPRHLVFVRKIKDLYWKIYEQKMYCCIVAPIRGMVTLTTLGLLAHSCMVGRSREIGSCTVPKAPFSAPSTISEVIFGVPQSSSTISYFSFFLLLTISPCFLPPLFWLLLNVGSHVVVLVLFQVLLTLS